MAGLGPHVPPQPRRAPVRVRVWAYHDGVLLPGGFEASAHPGRLDGSPPWGAAETEAAAVSALIALAESVGLEVCIGTDRDDEHNEDVSTWEAV